MCIRQRIRSGSFPMAVLSVLSLSTSPSLASDDLDDLSEALPVMEARTFDGSSNEERRLKLRFRHHRYLEF